MKDQKTIPLREHKERENYHRDNYILFIVMILLMSIAIVFLSAFYNQEKQDHAQTRVELGSAEIAKRSCYMVLDKYMPEGTKINAQIK